jgi:hypothetical protein
VEQLDATSDNLLKQCGLKIGQIFRLRDGIKKFKEQQQVCSYMQCRLKTLMKYWIYCIASISNIGFTVLQVYPVDILYCKYINFSWCGSFDTNLFISS